MVSGCPNRDGVAVYRDGVAEVVARLAIGGGELGSSASRGPGGACGLGEDVGRTLCAVVPVGSDHNGVTVHRYGVAELVTLIASGTVGSGKLCRLSQNRISAAGPAGGGFGEYVGRTGTRDVFADVEGRANDYGLTVEGYGGSESIVLNSTVALELVLLGPHIGRPAEYEGLAGIITGHPDHSDVAGHRHGKAELSAGGAS